MNNIEIVEAVIHDVGRRHHLKTFPVLWDACIDNKAFKTFVSTELVSHVWQCCKGREKYANNEWTLCELYFMSNYTNIVHPSNGDSHQS